MVPIHGYTPAPHPSFVQVIQPGAAASRKYRCGNNVCYQNILGQGIILRVHEWKTAAWPGQIGIATTV